MSIGDLKENSKPLDYATLVTQYGMTESIWDDRVNLRWPRQYGMTESIWDNWDNMGWPSQYGMTKTIWDDRCQYGITETIWDDQPFR